MPAVLRIFFIAISIIVYSMSVIAADNATEVIPMQFMLQSSDFANKAMIPAKFTCQSTNISPQLEWHGAPTGTKTFALIMDDPDATHGTWVHWVIFNIPASVNKLEANYQASRGVINATNSWGNTGYGGPCPPTGTHHYIFKLYALDIVLPLTSSASKEDLMQAMQGHILESTELTGLYANETS